MPIEDNSLECDRSESCINTEEVNFTGVPAKDFFFKEQLDPFWELVCIALLQLRNCAQAYP